MSITKYFPAMALGAVVVLLAACASQPAVTDAPKPVPVPAAAAAQAPAAGTEAETAAALEKKFQEAARGRPVADSGSACAG